MNRIHYGIAALLTVAILHSQQTPNDEIRRRYVDLTKSWADVRFTAAEQKSMTDGKQWEPLLLKGPDDPLATRILAAGEPTFDSMSRYYPGKILDRTVLGTYSDPQVASQYNDEFAIYWNGAIAANLQKGKFANGGVRPVAHNTVVVFRVGADREIFGTDREAFSSMRYESGYLPLVTGTYRKDGIEYRETAFATSPEAETAGWDVAFVGFQMKNLTTSPKMAAISADFLLMNGGRARSVAGTILDDAGAVLAAMSPADMPFDAPQQRVTREVKLAPNATARVIFKIPYLPDARKLLHSASPENFEREAKGIRDFWQTLLAKGAQIEVPEERVNNVWRALLLQNFVLADGPRFTYGSGLVYNDSTFPQENGFAAHVFAAFGFPDYADALQRNFLGMCVTPAGAGRKYQNRRAMVLHHLLENYRLTGKRDLFDRYRNDYYRVADEIVADRHSTMTPVAGEKPLNWGLLPPAKPGADVQASTQTVYVLGHNITNCQGLLDFGRFLVTTGIDVAKGQHYIHEGREFRTTLMDAMRRAAIRRPGRPPFLDLQTLFFRQTPEYGPEPYDDLALGRLQGTYSHYWVDMEFHYNFFNPREDVGQWLADYVQQRNGFSLGCTRSRSETDPRYGWINNVYDAGYYNYRLRQGHTSRFLLGLYSRLAYGMSRNLYLSSEGSPFIGYNTQQGGPVTAEYSFPNSASNADTLLMLRNALVLEELEDNVETGTLDLLSGAPRQWFEKGKAIKVSRMPTYFGDLAFSVTAASDGRTMTIDVQLPPAAGCKQVRVHLRHPRGLSIKSATLNGAPLQHRQIDKDVVTLNGGTRTASVKVTF